MNWFISPEELAEHRADAESRMGASNLGSDCIVRRKTGAFLTDEAAGTKVPVWEVVHTGPCRLRGARGGAADSRTRTLPGGQQESASPELHFPVSATNTRDGDWAEVASGEHAGAVLRLIGTPVADQATARRFGVAGEQRPKEWP